ncbi:protein of unknown function [Micrococcales bacterium KH10]|nr:protein of unknown function [Micrococcales bacterium KH10]
MSETQVASTRTHADADAAHALRAPEASHEPVAPVAAAGLLVGDADDLAERRADDMAERALKRLAGQSATDGGAERHQHGAGCGHVRRASAPAPAAATIGAAGGQLDSESTAQINAMRGGGRPLEGGLRAEMETAFGTSLGGVRIHDDARAAQLSSSMSAHAFTTGKDIFFGAGQFSPDTPGGRQVLAHELAHVISEPVAPVRRGLFGKFKAFVKGEDYVPTKSEESEQLRKDEKKQLKQEREEGIAGRKDLQHKIQNGGEPLEGSTPAERFAHLSRLLAAGIEQENKRLEMLTDVYLKNGKWIDGWDDDRAADDAFAFVYINGPEAKILKHVAPPRRNAQERLVSQVRKLRTSANVRVSMNQIETGKNVASDDVNAFYDSVAAEVRKRADQAVNSVTRDVAKAKKAGKKTPDEAKLKSDAFRTAMKDKVVPTARVFRAAATPELQAKLPPNGSKLELRYVDAAFQRYSIRGGGPKVVKESDSLDDFIEKWDTYGGYGELGGSGASGIASGVGSVIDFFDDGETEYTEGLTVSDGPSLLKSTPIIGEFSSSVASASDRKKKQKTALPGEDYSQDDNLREEVATTSDRVTSGIGTAFSILTSLKDAVSNAMKTLSTIKKALKSNEPRKALEAIKSGTDGLSSLVGAAKSSAELAEKINPNVKAAVAKVIPGFDIASAALAITGNAAEMADAGMYMHDTNVAIQSARIRGIDNKAGGKRVDVMVYPLTKVAQSHTIQLEQKTWATGKSVSDLATSIASVASGGGFGIPKAVEAGVSLLDTLHSFGHTVAKEILTAAAKLSEKESKLSLEGSAENALEKNPAMAVEGIIVRAALHDDPIAISFLSNYRVDGEPVTDYLDKIKTSMDPQSTGTDENALFEVRDAVLASMGDDADPKQIWEAYKPFAAKWKDLGQLRKQRNEMEPDKDGKKAKSRGFFWQVKMMLRSDEKHAQSKFKTSANYEEWQESQPKDPGASGPDISGPFKVKMICGDQVLPVGATDEQAQKFSEAVEKMSLTEYRQALNDPLNDEDARAQLRHLIAVRLSEQIGAKKSA